MTDSPTSQAMHLAMTELKEREQRISQLEEALYGVLKWDESRDYIVPYRVRDPILKALNARSVLNKENGAPVDLCCGFPVGGPCPGCPQSPKENGNG